MKRFLSFLLAVLMIVSIMVPMLTLLVSAEGNADKNANIAAVSDFPELIITEYHANACYFSNVYDSLMNGTAATEETRFLASTLYTNGCGEVMFAPVVHPGVGASVSGLYVKNEKEQWMSGNIVFDAATGTAKEGVQYYRRYNFTTSDNEIVEFIELYNAGAEPINLYDYQIVRDKDAFKHGDVPQYIDLYGGPLSSAAHGKYFKKAGNITEFDPDIAYYTKSNESTYVPVVVKPNDKPDASKSYYYEVEEGAFVNNPSEEEGAWLQPGQVAVLWNFTYRDWQYNMTDEVFKTYFSTNYGFGQNWDDILLLGMDGNSSNTDRYLPKKQETDSEMSEAGCVRIGIVHDKVAAAKPDDTARDTDWVSWILHAWYMGIRSTDPFALQNTVIGVTKVVDSDYVVYDQARNEYIPVSKEAGTADEKGCAVAGLQYYKPSPYIWGNGSNARSVAYMYGLDASASIKEGRAYIQNSLGLSPGILDNVQEAAFPNYSENTEALGKTPNLVITEVVPDNGALDAYEYVEILNISDAPLNVFDYSFLAHPTNITHYNEQYFNKISAIIPGEYGSILTSSGITKYQEGYTDLAPTNVAYQNGWLQPGETALLWAFSPDAYTEQATFDTFRSHYQIDENVKVFAMDADGTNGTGRPQRQDLQDTGFCMYGLISNDKLMWANNKYTSDPVLQPITYSSGLTKQSTRGIAVKDCESFVLCSPLYVAFEDVTIGVDYGHQYVWGKMQSVVSKCGSYLKMSYATSCDTLNFSGTGSVVNEAWKASPGKLIAEQKAGFITNTNKDRYVVYMQDFNGYGTVSGYDAVAQKLGITLPENCQAADNGSSHLLEISEGKLKVNNTTASDVKLVLMSDDALTLQELVVKYKIGETVYSSTSNSKLNIAIEGTNLVLTISANTVLEYDYITVYTDGNVISNPNEELYGNGFIITEFHKPNGANAAYKAMEITNVSDIARSLYDTMIVTTSKQTSTGVLQTWNHAIKLTAGCPVSIYDPQYKNLKHISNPSNCVVQPGESVVVWLMSNAEKYTDNNGKVTINTNDFRNYYKELGNEKLAEVDAKGNAVVKVIVAYDQSASDNYLRYALAKKTNIYYTTSDRSFFPEVFSPIVPQSDAKYSLGYVSQDKYDLVAALKFAHMGEIVEKDNKGNVTDVINVYAHQSILNGLSEAGVQNTSANVNTSNTGASISFRASIDAAYYNRVVELFGEANTTYGILIARADSAVKTDAMRPYLFDAADVAYINDNEDLRSVATSTRRSVYSNSHAVDAGYYTVTYSAMAYLAVETQAFGTITKYAENAYHQSVKQIAATAMMKYVDTATAKAEMAFNPSVKYYEIEAGKWSVYTREQIARLDVLCK